MYYNNFGRLNFYFFELIINLNVLNYLLRLKFDFDGLILLLGLNLLYKCNCERYYKW